MELIVVGIYNALSIDLKRPWKASTSTTRFWVTRKSGNSLQSMWFFSFFSEDFSTDGCIGRFARGVVVVFPLEEYEVMNLTSRERGSR